MVGSDDVMMRSLERRTEDVTLCILINFVLTTSCPFICSESATWVFEEDNMDLGILSPFLIYFQGLSFFLDGRPLSTNDRKY